MVNLSEGKMFHDGNYFSNFGFLSLNGFTYQILTQCKI